MIQSIVFMVSHPSAGGAQEILANIAEGFAERGASVRLFALYPTDRAVRVSRLQWEYIVPQKPRSVSGMIELGVATIRWFRRERPARVFTALPAANLMAAIGARLAGRHSRVIISHHSPVQTHNPLINLADGYTGSLRNVCKVVSVSDTVAASLERKPAAYRAKRVTIHNALPPRIENLLESLAEQHAPRRARRRRVVATGRLAAQKNYPMLIRAMVRLPDVTLDIIGDGPDGEALVAHAGEFGVQDRIRFLGFRPRDEALALLAEGDVFAQVSLFEGHSLALIEAARLGLPMIVSDVPVQIEGITAQDGERCAIVVPPQDDAALAAAITHLLEDEDEYRAAVIRSRQLGHEASYDAMMRAYEALAA